MERTSKQFEESQKYYATLEFVMCTCSRFSVDMHDETHFKPVWVDDAFNKPRSEVLFVLVSKHYNHKHLKGLKVVTFHFWNHHYWIDMHELCNLSFCPRSIYPTIYGINATWDVHISQL